MKTTVKPLLMTTLLGVTTLALAACTPSYGPPMKQNSLKTNHFGAAVSARSAQFGRYDGSYGAQKAGHVKKNKKKIDLIPGPFNPAYDSWGNRLAGKRNIAFQTPPPPPGAGQFQSWIDYEPQYLLYPGDQLDIVVASAQELSRTLTVGPDGRIVMPNVQPVMAAGRNFAQVERDLMHELSSLLRDPTVAVSPRAYSPAQIYVGGEVGQQGTYTLPGPVGALEAVIMAGGLRPTAQTSQVAVLRRAPNGGMMMRVVDLKNGMRNVREYNDNMQLRRGDIIFVPRSTIAEVGVWVSNFRAALPVDFNLSYQFGQNGGNGTTVITP